MDEMFDAWDARDVEDAWSAEDAWDAAPESPFDIFRDDGWISEVLQEVKSGKEATVYCCRAAPAQEAELVAVKMYRSRQVRTFRNSAPYREGRVIRDKRLRRATSKGSAAGQAVEFSSWIAHEFAIHCTLHAAGADVPRPLACAAGGVLLEYTGAPAPRRRLALSLPTNAILMEYVGDVREPAPHLNSVALEREEAHALFTQILRNVELWLAHDVVHGDLSAFNILYWQGAVTVIDFPQAVDPRANRNAEALLARDVENVYRYFARHGIRADPSRTAAWLWRRYMRGELSS